MRARSPPDERSARPRAGARSLGVIGPISFGSASVTRHSKPQLEGLARAETSVELAQDGGGSTRPAEMQQRASP